MNILVESLKRLYQSEPKKVSKEQLKMMQKKKQISPEDYERITGEKDE